MRFLSIYKSRETGEPPSAQHMADMGQLTALGARVRLAGSAVTVTDGPFSESKEVVGGFAILEAKSKAHAIELAKEFLTVAGDGECEVRQIYAGPAKS
jgi:hypothetical protein